MQDKPMIDDSRIRDRAYAIWEAEGCPDGCAERHWQQAEDDLRQGDARASASDAPGVPGRSSRRRSAGAG